MRKTFLTVAALMCVVIPNSLAFAGEKDDKPKVSQEEIRKLCHKLSSNDDDVRWQAAKKLIEAGGESTDMLGQILQGEWLEGRKLAAYLLGEIKDPAAVLPLASCLGDDEFHVRWKCAVSLKNIGRPAVDVLCQVLRTGNLQAKYCAAWTLGEIKDPSATAALAETATVEDHHLRWKSVISLKRIGPAAIDELKKLLEDESPKARHCAVWALDMLGGREAIGPLLGAISDAEADVRALAAKALAKYDGPKVRAALEALIEDESNAVRRQAVISLATLGRQIVDGENGAPGDDRAPRWGIYEAVHRQEDGAPDAPDAHLAVDFLTPSQGSRTVEGFCAEDGVWKARIAPDEVGEWFYKMTFTPAGGDAVVTHGMFSCDDSELVGALEVRRAPRPHLRAGGRPVYLAEAPLPVRGLPRAFAPWKALLDACAKHGFNLLRLDVQRLLFEAANAGQGRPNVMSLIDDILTHGHTHGIYFILTLFDEDHLRDDASWNVSAYNADNGGPLEAGNRLPMFYDPVSGEIARMQEDDIRGVIVRAGAHANVIFELCRNFNEHGSAVPFAKSWVQKRLGLFESCARPVMLSAADDAGRLCTVDGIDIAGIREGAAPEGRLPALPAECPADAPGAVSEMWLAMVGGGGPVSWTRTPAADVEDTIRFVGQAEKRVRVLLEFAGNEDFYALRPDAAAVLSSPPGVRVAAQSAGKRAVLYLAGSADGGEVVRLGMPAGEYEVRWLDARAGSERRVDNGTQDQGFIELRCPRFSDGIVAWVTVK
ncbi:MAG: HEAT repeat domain-containing protein [Planctomycetes bacterium]|nr:HEAT repeat domain-containing protein [Planctomycetota bacterium]